MTSEHALSTEVQPTSIQELAQAAIQSGMYKDMVNAEQAVMKIIAGRELGLSPLFSLQKLVFVQNQITCMGEVIIYKWQEQGYKWQRIFYNKEGENIDLPETKDKTLYGCGILLWSPQGKLLTSDADGNAKPSTFDLGRAAIAGLTTKDNWRNYPDRLLFYRAVAFTARDYTPGVTGGMTTTEEMQDVVALQKANVTTIPTGGGIATVEHINVEAPMCPIHNVPFRLSRWNTWTHPTDEKNDKGKTIWCSKDKVDKQSEESSEPKQSESYEKQLADAMNKVGMKVKGLNDILLMFNVTKISDLKEDQKQELLEMVKSAKITRQETLEIE